MSDTKAALLNYAPPSLRLRPWLRRGLLLGWAALTLYLAYGKWGLGVWLQVRMLQAQRAALRFVQPPDRIVYEGDVSRAARLLASPVYAEHDAGLDSPAAVSLEAGRIFHKLSSTLDDLDWWDERQTSPAEWAGAAVFADVDSDFQGDFYVYIHGHRAPAGEQRLVGVRAIELDDGQLAFEGDVSSVTGAFGRPKRVGPARAVAFEMVTFTLDSREGEPLRLFAPQPDVKDDARFTMAYESGSRRGMVEGRLKPDGTVEFKLLPEPASATRPHRSSTQPGREL